MGQLLGQQQAPPEATMGPPNPAAQAVPQKNWFERNQDWVLPAVAGVAGALSTPSAGGAGPIIGAGLGGAANTAIEMQRQKAAMAYRQSQAQQLADYRNRSLQVREDAPTRREAARSERETNDADYRRTYYTNLAEQAAAQGRTADAQAYINLAQKSGVPGAHVSVSDKQTDPLDTEKKQLQVDKLKRDSTAGPKGPDREQQMRTWLRQLWQADVKKAQRNAELAIEGGDTERETTFRAESEQSFDKWIESPAGKAAQKQFDVKGKMSGTTSSGKAVTFEHVE